MIARRAGAVQDGDHVMVGPVEGDPVAYMNYFLKEVVGRQLTPACAEGGVRHSGDCRGCQSWRAGACDDDIGHHYRSRTLFCVPVGAVCEIRALCPGSTRLCGAAGGGR